LKEKQAPRESNPARMGLEPFLRTQRGTYDLDGQGVIGFLPPKGLTRFRLIPSSVQEAP